MSSVTAGIVAAGAFAVAIVALVVLYWLLIDRPEYLDSLAYKGRHQSPATPAAQPVRCASPALTVLDPAVLPYVRMLDANTDAWIARITAENRPQSARPCPSAARPYVAR